MKNPIRRNKNIGTSKQGYGKNNSHVIPYPAIVAKEFYERLDKYEVVEKIINEHKFRFIIEQTRKNSIHSCSIDDLELVIAQIPKEHYGELELIILRQPTRKEELLKPVWGRLIYSYEFENDYLPAIIIEAVSLDKKFEWSKKLSIDALNELNRLKEDGHEFILDKRNYQAQLKLENIRRTQLLRTLPHEFGHYVHYQNMVIKLLSHLKSKLDKLDKQVDEIDSSQSNTVFDKWCKLNDEYNNKINKLEDIYFSLTTQEKEVFAHKYADNLKKKLLDII